MIDELKIKYADELNYLQPLFNDMGVTPNNSILVVKIDNAYTAIRNYLRLDETANLSNYRNAAVELATAYYTNAIRDLKKLNGDTDVVQLTMGSVSNTFSTTAITIDEYGLTESVKALLPLPYIRLY